MNKAQFSRDFLKLGYIFIVLILSACGTSNIETSTATLTVPTITKTPAPTSTVTTSHTETAAFEGFGFSTELMKALKTHIGLEPSIIKGVDGKYTVTATLLSSDNQPLAQSMYVIPSTLNEDLTSKNKFGNTPTMQTADGKKLYWIQKEQGWFAVEISTDINKPVVIPYGKMEIATRISIVEFPEAFSQEAIDWWSKTPGLYWEFTYLIQNPKTGEATTFGYLRNRALGEPTLTVSNSPVQYLNAWFAMDFPDGIRFQFFPTKWFDPLDNKNPKGDEWKILFTASGPEIMGIEENRNQYDNLLNLARNPNTNHEIVPVIIAQDNFFNDTNGLITLFVGQPSLVRLLKVPSNTIASMALPDGSGLNYQVFFDMHFPNLSAENAGFGVGWNKDDTRYAQFLPDDIQTIVIPSLIVLH